MFDGGYPGVIRRPVIDLSARKDGYNRTSRRASGANAGVGEKSVLAKSDPTCPLAVCGAEEDETSNFPLQQQQRRFSVARTRDGARTSVAFSLEPPPDGGQAFLPRRLLGAPCGL